MTKTQFIIEKLNIPAEYMDGINVEEMKGLKAGVPAWVNQHTLSDWAAEQESDCDETELAEKYRQLSAKCDVEATIGFERDILDNEAMADVFSDDFFVEWGHVFDAVGGYYAKGLAGVVGKDVQTALRYYLHAEKLLHDRDVEFVEIVEEDIWCEISELYYFEFYCKDIDIDYAQALKYHELTGNYEFIGDYYFDGKHCPVDYQKALVCYKKEDRPSVAEDLPWSYAELYRKMAECYLQLGNDEAFMQYMSRAAELKSRG